MITCNHKQVSEVADEPATCSVALIVLHTNVDAQCDKLATVVDRTKSTTLATVDVLHGHVSFMRH